MRQGVLGILAVLMAAAVGLPQVMTLRPELAAAMTLSRTGPTSRPTVIGMPIQRDLAPGAAMVARARPAGREFSLPGAFAVLGQRSIFARDGVALAPSGGGPTGPGGAQPEAALALRGVALDDKSYVAFIEDTVAHRTMQLKVGDALASGRVKQIGLDSLGYESGGKLTQVRMGQNLLGMLLPPPAPPPPAAPPGAPAPGEPGPPPGAMPQGPVEAVYRVGPGGNRVRTFEERRAK